jgi:hypothetical protein
VSNPIILVGSCGKNRDAGCLDAIRDTWGKDSRIPYRFFIGKDCAVRADDELVFPDVLDGYFAQNAKHQAALSWAVQNGYDYVFLADDDTFIHTRRLLESGFEGHDYLGNAKDTPHPPAEHGVSHDYCHGGCGYWLSRKSCENVIRASFDLSRPDHRIDDQWFGLVLKDAGILPEHDPRYSMGSSYEFRQDPVLPSNDKITCHLSKSMGVYDKWWMVDSYRGALG